MDVSALFGRTPQQQTLAAPVEVTGRTLHSGEIARMTLHPANPGLGICFSRSDRTFADGLILARWTNLATGALCTQLENGRGVRVRLVEHVLAALAACAVDNAIIELDGDEPPVLDGSAALFVDAIQRAGIVRQAAPLSVIEVLEPVQVRDGERHATLHPARTPMLDACIDFPEPPIGTQQLRLPPTAAVIRRELVPARTFGYAGDREQLMQRGLARGAALSNTVVMHAGRVLNPDGLRFADECVRHKLLDVVGDLMLAGAPILGEYVAHQPGHALTAALLRRLFSTDSAWRLRTMRGATTSVPDRPTSRRVLEQRMRQRGRPTVSRASVA